MDQNGLCYGYQSFMRVVVFTLIAVLVRTSRRPRVP